MRKVISYRQKIIELAKIYKIDKSILSSQHISHAYLLTKYETIVFVL